MRRPDLAPHPVLLERPSILQWQEGRSGAPYVHAFDSGRPGPDVLLTALVHGNEYAGAIVLHDLLSMRFRPSLGRLTLAFCNVQAFLRFDPDRPDASRYVDEDMNRVWVAPQLDGTRSSIELARARELRPFVDRCTHLLDLHSMHEPCAPLLVTGLLRRNIEFARRLRSAGQIVIDEGHADGVRMRDYGALGDPAGDRIALLLEAGQHWDPVSLVASRDLTMRFLVKAGSIGADEVPHGWMKPDTAAAAPVRVTHRVVARTSDFRFLADYRGGEVLQQAGTAIAMDGEETVTTPYDDCVLVMPSLRQLRPGVTTVRLGHRVAN